MRFVGGTYHYDVDAAMLTAEQVAEVTVIAVTNPHRAQVLAETYEAMAALAAADAADAARPKRDARYLSRSHAPIVKDQKRRGI